MCGKLKEMQKDYALSNIRIKRDNRKIVSVSIFNILRQRTHEYNALKNLAPVSENTFFSCIFAPNRLSE